MFGFRIILDDKGLTVEERLDAIERELAEIKIGPSSPQSLRVVMLKGWWKGLRVSKHDNAKVKKSFFKNASDFTVLCILAREEGPKETCL